MFNENIIYSNFDELEKFRKKNNLKIAIIPIIALAYVLLFYSYFDLLNIGNSASAICLFVYSFCMGIVMGWLISIYIVLLITKNESIMNIILIAILIFSTSMLFINKAEAFPFFHIGVFSVVFYEIRKIYLYSKKVIKNSLFSTCIEYNHEVNNSDYKKIIEENYQNKYNSNIEHEDYSISVDDIFTGTHKGKNFNIIENDIFYYISSGKSRNKISLFKGICFLADIDFGEKDIIITKENIPENLKDALSFYFPDKKINFCKEKDYSITIKDNKLCYWCPSKTDNFEVKLLKSIEKNIEEIEKTKNQIAEFLKLIDIFS